ncbi:MAG: amino acid permease [Gammaproteobacteria bacterium]|nr:amino acid permease [Gammaproteobacteria bacterium]
MGGARRGARVSYRQTGHGYFERRRLARHAGVWSLWALGVGAVISGDFFGWNFGLGAGGFGGLALAALLTTVMYVCLCCSMAEMAAALPHTGGAYSFARSGLGPWGGFVTGLAENMEYVLMPAVIVVGIGSYPGAVFGTPEALDPLWWLAAYAAFVTLHVRGTALALGFALALTLTALAILAVFFVAAVPHFSMAHALDIEPAAGGSRWLPHGWAGVAWAMPFAIWFYLAIEQLPLAAEESHAPGRDLPRAMLLALATLVVTGFLVMFLNSGVAPGAQALASSASPLLLGFRTVLGAGASAEILALVAVAGLLASFHSIMFAYARNIFSLSRAGYFPAWLSLTHGGRRTPHAALVTGAVVGYAVALAIHYADALFGAVPVAAVLLNMAVFGAVISYALQMLAFLALRRRLPGIERPFVSPLGVAGAWVALAIALATLLFLLLNPAYRIGVWGSAAWFALGLLYFALRARRRLVHSPEEAFALSHRGAAGLE